MMYFIFVQSDVCYESLVISTSSLASLLLVNNIVYIIRACRISGASYNILLTKNWGECMKPGDEAIIWNGKWNLGMSLGMRHGEWSTRNG